MGMGRIGRIEQTKVGEVHEGTVLTVDLVGPARGPKVMDRLFTALVLHITSEGGVVNRFRPDGAVCLFGVTKQHVDHAARALRAAEQLTVALQVVPGVTAAIGVATGEISALNDGTVEEPLYTAIGEAVAGAALLCEDAKGLEVKVLAAERTILAAGEAAAWSAASAEAAYEFALHTAV